MASAIFPTQNVRIPQQQVDNTELDTESCMSNHQSGHSFMRKKTASMY